ncbi:Hypothetical protein PSM36_1248 [Proteiniphilum saccharofermentans]|uniref:Coenzyme PQQ synthesis protein D (PqqD) n=1 Tax=Proteiniphilum saccharofermentans TaxID=1642647 RepID=A0A1R3T224_9BACT|nr:PqqD family protein [Proteiniphilum saccharofermentans]SCD20072.1 Hypothetical protein PSM36_1248 [Proteiniphilum saccharofermentans]
MRIKQGFKLRTVGKEYIVAGEGLAQIDFNKLISLNSSAAYLWQEVEGKDFDEKTLADLLVSKYGIPVGQALTDANDIARSWIDAGIVEE